MTSVTIPNSVTSICESAFSGCTGLATVNYNAVNCITWGQTPCNGCTAFAALNLGTAVPLWTLPTPAIFHGGGDGLHTFVENERRKFVFPKQVFYLRNSFQTKIPE